ncbi:Protein of unknown function [Bacillus mobilis]|nr:Protein of unknown function [Bacillus mobilis]
MLRLGHMEMDAAKDERDISLLFQ